MVLSSYEKKRAETIAANAAQMDALGLTSFNLINKTTTHNRRRVTHAPRTEFQERRPPSQRLASLVPVNYSEFNAGVPDVEDQAFTADRDRRTTKIPIRYADEQYAIIRKKKFKKVKHETRDDISVQDAVAAGKLNTEAGNYHLASQYFTRAISKLEPCEDKSIYIWRAFAASKTLVQANLGLAFQDIKVRLFHELAFAIVNYKCVLLSQKFVGDRRMDDLDSDMQKQVHLTIVVLAQCHFQTCQPLVAVDVLEYGLQLFPLNDKLSSGLDKAKKMCIYEPKKQLVFYPCCQRYLTLNNDGSRRKHDCVQRD